MSGIMLYICFHNENQQSFPLIQMNQGDFLWKYCIAHR